MFYPEATVYNSQSKEKITIGTNTSICGQLLIFKYGGNIKIGNSCYIGMGTRIWSGESVTIGNNVLISHNVSIVDTNAHEMNHLERAERYEDLISNGPWKTKGNVITSAIVINDYAWISFGATVLKGVTVGKGAIVSAGAVVTKDVPDFTIVAGNPATIVRYLDNL
jgi:acetyltransferase-like isoleucine patch superfamily enzyme